MNMDKRLFDALGFHWDKAAVPDSVPVHSVEHPDAAQ
jgi:hypothetical protein